MSTIQSLPKSVLGSAALLIALRVDSRILWREAAMATVAVMVFAVAVQGGIQRTEGIGLLVLMVTALWVLVGPGGTASPLVAEVEQISQTEDTTTYEVFRTLVGLAGTIGGSWLLVEGATTVADELGLNDGFIGLTLVAIGTSLPELVTAVTAARAGHDELIVGNLLGSNLFNSLAVGGVVGVLGDGVLVDPSLARFDTAVMLIVCVGAFIAMWTRRELGRIEGGTLLVVFFAFLILTYLGEISDDTAAAVEATAPAVTAMIGG